MLFATVGTSVARFLANVDLKSWVVSGTCSRTDDEDEAYQRVCTEEEIAILEAYAAAARDAERAEDEQLRDAWFAMLKAELPSPAPPSRKTCRRPAGKDCPELDGLAQGGIPASGSSSCTSDP